jgi:hypothetical protein
MTKLIVGKVIEEGHGQCDFCQEEDVYGFLGEMEVPLAKYKGTVTVIDGWEYSKRIGCWDKVIKGDYRDVKQYEAVTEKVGPLICQNCVNQLAKSK